MEESLGQAFGDDVSLYQDITSTNWGTNWREKIEAELVKSDFFIAVLTPSYFNRKHCRYEFERAVELGKPIFPIYYFTSNLLENDKIRDKHKKSNKEAIADATRIAEKAESLQYRDFRKLRNKPLDSEESQNFVDELAEELIRELRN